MNAYFFIFTFMLCYNNTLIVTRKRKKKSSLIYVCMYILTRLYYIIQYLYIYKNQIALGKKTAHPKEYFRLSSYITDGNTFFSRSRCAFSHYLLVFQETYKYSFCITLETNIIVMYLPLSYLSYVVQ